MNILSYTSLNSFPCREDLDITPGKTCLSEKTICKLKKLEQKLNKGKEDIMPVIIDQELLPSDGSPESNMIRRLAAALDCSSEYCILNSSEIKDILNEDEVKKRKR